jgi:hypothetical protein
MPGGVGGHRRVVMGGHQSKVGGCDHALRMPSRVAARLQLLKVSQLLDVDLGGQVPTNGRLECLVGPKHSPRECPGAIGRGRVRPRRCGGPPAGQRGGPTPSGHQRHLPGLPCGVLHGRRSPQRRWIRGAERPGLRPERQPRGAGHAVPRAPTCSRWPRAAPSTSATPTARSPTTSSTAQRSPTSGQRTGTLSAHTWRPTSGSSGSRWGDCSPCRDVLSGRRVSTAKSGRPSTARCHRRRPGSSGRRDAGALPQDACSPSGAGPITASPAAAPGWAASALPRRGGPGHRRRPPWTPPPP